MWCLNQVEGLMVKHQLVNQYCSEIVVSNTFTQEWEMTPYFELAQRYNYKVVSIIVENRHGSKNVHGVSDEKMEVMRQRFDVKL